MDISGGIVCGKPIQAGRTGGKGERFGYGFELPCFVGAAVLRIVHHRGTMREMC